MGINEKTIPATRPHNTFIPFNLRKGFRMPTFLDQDAIYAYHFYHLLQRAENVYLFFNTEVGTFGSGEKSRFLLQIEEELSHINPNIQLHKKLASAPLPVNTVLPEQLHIEKTDEVMEVLNTYLSQGKPDEEKQLSPSALTTYINCPVQFYFKYIAKLYEPEELDEELNHRIFGNVLHKTIELIYVDILLSKLFNAGLIKPDMFEKAIKNKDEMLKEIRQVWKEQNQEDYALRNRFIQQLTLWLVNQSLFKYKKQLGLDKDYILQIDAKRQKANEEIDSILDEIKMDEPGVFKKIMEKKALVWVIHDLLALKTPETTITKGDIKLVLSNAKRIRRKLLDAFEEEKFRHHKEGMNLLLKNVIFKLVKKILENDQHYTPFNIIGLEAESYKTEITLPDGRKVWVSGVIDRVDEIILEQEGQVPKKVVAHSRL